MHMKADRCAGKRAAPWKAGDRRSKQVWNDRVRLLLPDLLALLPSRRMICQYAIEIKQDQDLAIWDSEAWLRLLLTLLRLFGLLTWRRGLLMVLLLCVLLVVLLIVMLVVLLLSVGRSADGQHDRGRRGRQLVKH